MKIFIVLVICFGLVACFYSNHTIKGNGNFTSENRTTSAISSIEVRGDIEVVVRQGATNVQVEADENLLEHIMTEVQDGKLVVKSRENVNLKSSNPIKVNATVERLRVVKVTGSGDINFAEKIAVDEAMEFSITGSGNITALVNAPGVTSKITGSGNLRIMGETRDEKVSITGSGNFNGLGLKSETAMVTIAGSGDAKVYAERNLKTSIAGSGSIKYAGNALVQNKIAGSGSVDKVESTEYIGK